jgi:hypothetical protein
MHQVYVWPNGNQQWTDVCPNVPQQIDVCPNGICQINVCPNVMASHFLKASSLDEKGTKLLPEWTSTEHFTNFFQILLFIFGIQDCP